MGGKQTSWLNARKKQASSQAWRPPNKQTDEHGKDGADVRIYTRNQPIPTQPIPPTTKAHRKEGKRAERRRINVKETDYRGTEDGDGMGLEEHGA